MPNKLSLGGIPAVLGLIVVLGTLTFFPFASTPLPPTHGHGTRPPRDEATQRITVPAGFTIHSYVQGLGGKPRFMAFGPDGLLYLSLMDAGTIIRLPDRDQNGQADRVEVVATDLELPHGLEWHAGWLYVAEGSKVERLQ